MYALFATTFQTINDHTKNEPLQPIELITYAWQISCGLVGLQFEK
jgi:hypothetical protein